MVHISYELEIIAALPDPSGPAQPASLCAALDSLSLAWDTGIHWDAESVH